MHFHIQWHIEFVPFLHFVAQRGGSNKFGRPTVLLHRAVSLAISLSKPNKKVVIKRLFLYIHSWHFFVIKRIFQSPCSTNHMQILPKQISIQRERLLTVSTDNYITTYIILCGSV